MIEDTDIYFCGQKLLYMSNAGHCETWCEPLGERLYLWPPSKWGDLWAARLGSFHGRGRNAAKALKQIREQLEAMRDGLDKLLAGETGVKHLHPQERADEEA